MLMSNIGLDDEDFGVYRDNTYQYIYLVQRPRRDLFPESLARGIGCVARDLGSDEATAYQTTLVPAKMLFESWAQKSPKYVARPTVCLLYTSPSPRDA